MVPFVVVYPLADLCLPLVPPGSGPPVAYGKCNAERSDSNNMLELLGSDLNIQRLSPTHMCSPLEISSAGSPSTSFPRPILPL